MKRRLYIAYGSNINLEQMKFRCPEATVVGKGTIVDHELLFKGNKLSAFATVEPKEGAGVPVLVWSITEDDEKALDRYEGYPRFYKKEELKVKTEKGMEKIMAYVMTAGRAIGIPSAFYLDGIEKGYAAAGFDEEYLHERVDYCKELSRQEQMKTNAWMQQGF